MGGNGADDSHHLGDWCRRFDDYASDCSEGLEVRVLRGADVKLISTDKDTARDLRRLLAASDAGGSSSSSVSTITSPVIAKVVSAISAGDHTQKTARLMTISGGAIVATGQTVQIRNVGSGAVAANTVVLTEPCGKLGQCFVRNASQTPVSTSIERYTKFVSQLAPETGLETKAWTVLGAQSVWPNPWDNFLFNIHTYSLEHLWNPLQTPTSIDSNGNRIYEDRMRGIRFAIDGHHEPGLWINLLQQHFTSPNNPATGKAAILPTSNSHFSPNITQIEIAQGQFQTQSGYGSVSTTHYRVWIDGIDRTGIISLSTPFPHDIMLTTVPRRTVGGLLPVSITAGSYEGKTVWFDIWVTVRTFNRPRYYGGDPTAAASYYPACSVAPFAPHHRSRFNFANVNGKRYDGDQYRVTFSDNGPGGASTLDVATGGGWTLTNSSAGFKLVKAGTGAIELNWLVESPVLTCSIDAKINSPSGASGNMRYLPSGTQYRHRNDNNSVIDYGEWNPQGTTVFNQVARAFGSTYYTKGSANSPASFFTGFPGTITIEKI